MCVQARLLPATHAVRSRQISSRASTPPPSAVVSPARRLRGVSSAPFREFPALVLNASLSIAETRAFGASAGRRRARERSVPRPRAMPSTMRLPALYDSGESTLDARAFASSATTRLGPSEYGPGSAFGKQADSRAKNQPSFQFSRVDRLADTRPFFGEAYARDMLQAHEAALKPKFQRPPPGAHDAPEPRWSSFGRSGVTHSFGRETLGRERAPAPHHDPYASAAVADVDRLTGASARGANRSTFGRQPTHRDATVFPAARIDKALPREHRATRMQYLGRGFDERQYAGAYSPTGEKFLKTAPVVHSVGPQALSTKRTARSVGFGSSPRVTMIDDTHRMPWTSDDYNRGPGMYQQTADFRQTRRRHRPSAYWTGAREGRRAPKMYPMTSRELRATHKKADAAKLADGTKKRLWA